MVSFAHWTSAEERICEFEDRVIEIIQNEMQRKKTVKEIEQSIQTLGQYIKYSNI